MRLRFSPGRLAVGEGGVWLADASVPVLVRIDPGCDRVVATIVVAGDEEGPGIADVAAGAGAVWVLGPGDGVVRVDPATNRPEATIGLGTGLGPLGLAGSVLAAGEDGVWVTCSSPASLTRVDPATNTVSLVVPLDRSYDNLAVGEDGLWAGAATDEIVSHLDPTSGRVVASISTGGRIDDLSVGAGAVWAGLGASNGEGGQVVRIDPVANQVDGSVEVGDDPAVVHAGPAGVWEVAVISGEGGTTRSEVRRVDPGAMVVVASIPVEGQALSLAEGEGALWVSAWDHRSQSGRVVRVDPQANAVVALIDLPDLEVALTPGPPPAPAGAGKASPRKRPLAAYRHHSRSYDLATDLFGGLRRQAVERLALEPGEVVLDVGCGTGLCFSYLEDGVGPKGRVVGIDQSPEMLERASERAEANRWDNVTLIGSSVEEAEFSVLADAALFCATHDILGCPQALENVVRHLRPGGRVVATGAKWAPPWMVPVNLAVFFWNAPYVSSFQGFDRPWRHLIRLVDGLSVETVGLGAGYLLRATVPEPG